MTGDRPGSGVPSDGPPPRLTDDEVARLLAEVGEADRVEERTPPEVAARLDDVLAGLVAERGRDDSADMTGAPGGAGATVTPLAPRRRWGPRLLVAAAVLAAVGLGAGVVGEGLAGLGGAADSESATAGDAAGSSAESEASGSGSAESGAESGADSGGGSEPGSAAEEDARNELQAPAPQRAAIRVADRAELSELVRAVGLRRDVAALRDDSPEADDDLDDRTYDGAAANRATKVSRGCAQPGGPGRRVAVRYAGEPATLVVRRTADDRLDGRVYDCALGLQVDGVEIAADGE